MATPIKPKFVEPDYRYFRLEGDNVERRKVFGNQVDFRPGIVVDIGTGQDNEIVVILHTDNGKSVRLTVGQWKQLVARTQTGINNLRQVLVTSIEERRKQSLRQHSPRQGKE